jgi:N4-(beta-N-acetylglucosaminyl)-L-asparaginase
VCLLQASSCIEVLQLNYLAVVLKYCAFSHLLQP